MESVSMPLQLAPNSLTQPILPNWSFHLFNVNLGVSSNAAVELIVGKLKLLESKDLTQRDRDILQVFLGDVSAVRQIKASRPKR